MLKCSKCGSELPLDSQFCLHCGAPLSTEKDVYQVSGEGLVGKVKEIIRDADVKRIVIKDEKGKVLLSIPVTWSIAGGLATLALAPWLVALGVVAGVVAKCTIEVERSPSTATTTIK
jgi:uncharacterized protein DUF4342/zinc ribbon protein